MIIDTKGSVSENVIGPRDAQRAAHLTEAILERSSQFVRDRNKKLFSDQSRGNAMQARVTKAVIVLLEGDHGFQEMLKLALEREDAYRVYCFSDAVEVLHFTRFAIPDLFILDDEHAERADQQLSAQLQANTGKNVPCLFLNTRLVSSGSMARYSWVLSKPFSLDTFLKRVKDALSFAPKTRG